MKLFVFGSTGDLVKRKILPALHKFKDLELFMLGRKDLDNQKYNEEYCKKCSEKFKLRLKYMQIEFNKGIYQQLDSFLDKKDANYFYISMPPNFILDLIRKIKEIKENGFPVQILIEKPFGPGLREAARIKKFIKKNALTKEVYLSDHYLFKKNIHSIKKSNFKNLKIVSLEYVGLEGREYYDSVGAIRDMIQSHFLNILQRLVEFSERDIRIISIKLGQYRGYQKELGKKSNTETYAKIKFLLKDKVVEFETGKGYPKKENFIEIDGIRYEIISDDSDYANLFSSFFRQKKENFPDMNQAINNWRVIEKIEKKKPDIEFY